MKTMTVKGVTFGEGVPKICVPIVAKSLEEIREEAEKILQGPVDMVEWRADWFCEVRNPEKMKESLALLRRCFSAIPLLVTYRTRQEGGEGELSDKEYEDFCLAVAETELTDFLDVELSAGEKAVLRILDGAHKHGVKVILSSHDFQKTPQKEEIIRRLCAMQTLGGDMVKAAVMPNSRKDVLTLMEATLEMKEKWADRPLITMSMAGMGTISRMAGEFFGSDVTFATAGKASAPGQIPAECLKEGMKMIHQSLKKKEESGNVYLIGFMGSGKSAVSRELAEQFHRKSVEMDEEIQAQQGMTIPEIFEKFGEDYFRKIESRLLREVAQEQNLVVSCGGGIVLKPENVEEMQKHGKVVLLTAKPETILARVMHDENRPLLKGKKNLEDMKALMEERRERYEMAADFIISTDERTIRSIAKEIAEKICLNREGEGV